MAAYLEVLTVRLGGAIWCLWLVKPTAQLVPWAALVIPPLGACIFKTNPAGSEHHSSSTLLLCGDPRWQTGFANQRYSKAT